MLCYLRLSLLENGRKWLASAWLLKRFSHSSIRRLKLLLLWKIYPQRNKSNFFIAVAKFTCHFCEVYNEQQNSQHQHEPWLHTSLWLIKRYDMWPVRDWRKWETEIFKLHHPRLCRHGFLYISMDRLACQAAQVILLQLGYVALPLVLLNWFLSNVKVSFYSIDYGLIFCLPLF